MSTIQTNFAKWYESAARFHASPAVRLRPCSSASRASCACMSPFATHAGSHSSQFSTPLVTRWKSLKSTPCDTKRGAQCAIASLTRSSGIYPHLMARISYVDPSTITDPELAEDMEFSRRYGTPRPETQAIRFHVPAVAKAFMRPWKTIFREGRVEHSLKELCRVYVSQTIACDY